VLFLVEDLGIAMKLDLMEEEDSFQSDSVFVSNFILPMRCLSFFASKELGCGKFRG
jgi:hypothetical protein